MPPDNNAESPYGLCPKVEFVLTLSTDKASTRTQIKERYTGFDFKYEFGTNAL